MSSGEFTFYATNEYERKIHPGKGCVSTAMPPCLWVVRPLHTAKTNFSLIGDAMSRPYQRAIGAAQLTALGLVMYASIGLGQSTSGPTSAAGQSSMTAESIRLYTQMYAVLSHPRCVNCHPRDDTPKQGLDQHIHSPPMTRGPQDRGPLGLSCAACHTGANYDVASRVPGAPDWHLAPASMAWEGKSAGELCRLLVDRSKNGNRDLQATVKHLTEDKLVAWGWAPGISVNGKPRQAVPVPRTEFNSIVIAWAKSGGACPE